MQLPERRFLPAAAALIAGVALLLGLPGCGGESAKRVAGWKQLHPGESGVESVLTVPGSPNVVYAVTLSDGVYKIFKSTDGGASWSRITGDKGAGFSLLAVDPARPGTLYGQRFRVVAEFTSPAGLAKSMDGGVTWTPANRGLPETSVLAVNPMSSRTLYAAGARGIFKSANGGASWARVWRSPKGTAVNALAIDPRSPSILFGGTAPTGPWTRGTVFKSTDGGRSWRRTGFRSESGPAPGIDGIAIDPRKPRTLYVTASYGFYKSADGGQNWTKLTVQVPGVDPSVLYPSTGVPAFAVLAIDSSRLDTVYVSAYDVETDVSFVLKSTTGGRTWAVVRRITPDNEGEPIPFSNLAIDPTGRRVYGAMESRGRLYVCERCWKISSPARG